MKKQKPQLMWGVGRVDTGHVYSHLIFATRAAARKYASTPRERVVRIEVRILDRKA